VPGKLGVFKRNGFMQVTLGGHPLYTFLNDHKKANATGEGLKSFGGTWSIVKDPSAPSNGMTPTTTSTPAPTPTSPYPGY
jgi:hypothetical protein